MNLIKYIALELKAKKEGSLYSIRNKKKSKDLLLLLNYLFFEYTRKDLDLITKNLAVIDEEQDDEIILHGHSRSLFLDLTDQKIIYISLLTDYLDFEDSLNLDSTNLMFVDQLKKKKFDHFKIDRNNFLNILESWHKIIEKQPHSLILSQDKNNLVTFQLFENQEAAELYEKQYCPTKN